MGSPEDLQHRLAFLGIGPADERLLRALGPILEENAEALAHDFYRHLLCFSETRALLADRERRRHLLAQQQEHLRTLAAPLDADYVASRRELGESLERSGLDVGWYLGAYAHYISLLSLMVEDAAGDDVEQYRRLLLALVRRMLLDAQLSVEGWIGRREAVLEFSNEELAKSQRALGRECEEQRWQLRQLGSRGRR